MCLLGMPSGITLIPKHVVLGAFTWYILDMNNIKCMTLSNVSQVKFGKYT